METVEIHRVYINLNLPNVSHSAGLFPLLTYAAMNVKPALLAIYEAHFVPLGRSIKPALTGLLIGVLPGLEEGSEHFDRYTHYPL